jgi:hypothetical protein
MTKKYKAAGVLLLLGICWGCGSGDFEQRLDNRINALKTGSKFNILSPAIDVPGTQLSIRLPQDFKNPPLTADANVDGKPVDPKRLKPNVTDVVELKATYEGFIEDKNHGKQHYYLYISVSTDKTREFYPKNLQSDLVQKINDATPLNDITAQTPEGRTVDWKECRATTNQLFYYVLPSGEGKFVTLPGTVDAYFHDENGALVTLIWRWPTSIEQSIDIKSWADLVAGCVKVKPKAGAAGE